MGQSDHQAPLKKRGNDRQLTKDDSDGEGSDVCFAIPGVCARGRAGSVRDAAWEGGPMAREAGRGGGQEGAGEGGNFGRESDQTHEPVSEWAVQRFGASCAVDALRVHAIAPAHALRASEPLDVSRASIFGSR